MIFEKKRAFQALMKKIPRGSVVEITKIMHWLVFYKDHRDDLRREASFQAKTFMTSLAERFGLTLEEINFLTPPEVIGLFAGKKITRGDIRARIPSRFVLLSTPGKITLFTGNIVEKVIDRELARYSTCQQREVKGLIASPGRVVGPVVIVRHTVSLSKVKDGDILVAVTTHPDYVPAMKKCLAFVTDEGGITSHAAIVAREMKKPCLVGASGATRTFKDGDVVEIDAVKGIARKF